MRRLFVLSVLTLGWPALATEVTLNGEGHVGAKPDFVKVIARVSADCYASASAASAANTALANKLKDAMNGTKAQKDESVFVNQGQTERKSLLGPYQNSTNSQPEICNGWSASSTLELRLSDLTAWPALQDKITQLLDQAAASVDPKSNSARTVGTVSRPTPSLLPETQSRISDESYVAALKDVERKADLTAKFYNMCVMAAKTLSPSGGYQIPYGAESAGRSASMDAPQGGGQGVDLNYGMLYSHTNVSVVYDIAECPRGVRK